MPKSTRTRLRDRLDDLADDDDEDDVDFLTWLSRDPDDS